MPQTLPRILERTQTTFVLVFALVFLAGAPLNPRPKAPVVFATEVRLSNPDQRHAAFDPPGATLADPVEREVQLIAGTERRGKTYEDEVTHASVFVTARSRKPYGHIVIGATCPDEAAAVRVLNRYPKWLDPRPLGAAGFAMTREFVEAERRRVVREQSELERKLRGNYSPLRGSELRKRLKECRANQSKLAGDAFVLRQRHEEFLRSAPRWELVRAPHPLGARPLPPGAILAARIGVATVLALIVCLCIGVPGARHSASPTGSVPDLGERDDAE